MNFPSPVTARRMGRPALNVEETKVRLTAGAKARIVALVGEQRMAAFIREAVDAAILAREAEQQPARPPKKAQVKPSKL